MSSKLAMARADSAAHEVLRRYKIDALPVCPFFIANEEGIAVEAKASKSRGVSGFLVRVENEFGIGYASHIQNEGFIRFTISHELGHYFMPGHAQTLFAEGQTVHQSKSGFVSSQPLEREADFFATSLLMPETLFCAALSNAGTGFPAIDSLHATCKTSLTSTAIRYARFAEDPVAIIVSSGLKVKYCFISKSLSRVDGLPRLRRDDPIPTGTHTSKFNSDTSNISKGRRAAGWTSLDDWFDGAPQVEMKEDVVGLGTYGRTLTVLFTEEPLDDEGSDESGD